LVAAPSQVLASTLDVAAAALHVMQLEESGR
jgi:hypothetical protein